MVMLRPSEKAYKIAKKVLNQKGVTVKPPKSQEKMKLKGPYLQH